MWKIYTNVGPRDLNQQCYWQTPCASSLSIAPPGSAHFTLEVMFESISVFSISPVTPHRHLKITVSASKWFIKHQFLQPLVPWLSNYFSYGKPLLIQNLMWLLNMENRKGDALLKGGLGEPGPENSLKTKALHQFFSECIKNHLRGLKYTFPGLLPVTLFSRAGLVFRNRHV